MSLGAMGFDDPWTVGVVAGAVIALCGLVAVFRVPMAHPARPHPVRSMGTGFGLVLVGIVVLLTSISQLDSAAVTEVATQPSSGPSAVGPPARVLVLIDVSQSMNEPLDRALPNGVSRIQAVKLYALPRIQSLNREGDRIGVWLVSSSNKGLPPQCNGQGAPCRLQPLVDETPAVREVLQSAIGSAQPNNGGTPLYSVIAQGVQELQEDPGPADTVSSLVVITDGFENASENAEADLDAATDKDRPVQVLITAAGREICETELTPAILQRFGGACYDATTTDAVKAARDSVRDALRKRLPPPTG